MCRSSSHKITITRQQDFINKNSLPWVLKFPAGRDDYHADEGKIVFAFGKETV